MEEGVTLDELFEEIEKFNKDTIRERRINMIMKATVYILFLVTVGTLLGVAFTAMDFHYNCV